MFKLAPKEYRAAHILYPGGVAILFPGRGYGQQIPDQIILHDKKMDFFVWESGVSAINNY